MNVEEKRKLADEMLAWLKETERQSWESNSVLLDGFSEINDSPKYDCWKAFDLLRFCGRIIYNNPNGRKGAHVESFIPIQGFGAFPMAQRLSADKKVAYKKAIDSLSKYNVVMFGYWAGVWAHLNKIDQTNEPNPFKDFVKLARTLAAVRQSMTGGEG